MKRAWIFALVIMTLLIAVGVSLAGSAGFGSLRIVSANPAAGRAVVQNVSGARFEVGLGDPLGPDGYVVVAVEAAAVVVQKEKCRMRLPVKAVTVITVSSGQ